MRDVTCIARQQGIAVVAYNDKGGCGLLDMRYRSQHALEWAVDNGNYEVVAATMSYGRLSRDARQKIIESFWPPKHRGDIIVIDVLDKKPKRVYFVRKTNGKK